MISYLLASPYFKASKERSGESSAAAAAKSHDQAAATAVTTTTTTTAGGDQQADAGVSRCKDDSFDEMPTTLSADASKASRASAPSEAPASDHTSSRGRSDVALADIQDHDPATGACKDSSEPPGSTENADGLAADSSVTGHMDADRKPVDDVRAGAACRLGACSEEGSRSLEDAAADTVPAYGEPSAAASEGKPGSGPEHEADPSNIPRSESSTVSTKATKSRDLDASTASASPDTCKTERTCKYGSDDSVGGDGSGGSSVTDSMAGSETHNGISASNSEAGTSASAAGTGGCPADGSAGVDSVKSAPGFTAGGCGMGGTASQGSPDDAGSVSKPGSSGSAHQGSMAKSGTRGYAGTSGISGSGSDSSTSKGGMSGSGSSGGVSVQGATGSTPNGSGNVGGVSGPGSGCSTAGGSTIKSGPDASAGMDGMAGTRSRSVGSDIEHSMGDPGSTGILGAAGTEHIW